jgi:hypothetical protein
MMAALCIQAIMPRSVQRTKSQLRTERLTEQRRKNMLTKKSLPITAALIVVIALASLGMAYGLWSDNLVIDGSVSLGNLDVNFVPGGSIPEVDPYGVGECTVVYGDDVATITVTGAYPGYQCNPMLTVTNDGTVPASGNVTLAPYMPVAGVGIGGVGPIAFVLAPDGVEGFTFPIEVWDTPPMGGTYAFSYALTFTQAPIP